MKTFIHYTEYPIYPAGASCRGSLWDFSSCTKEQGLIAAGERALKRMQFDITAQRESGGSLDPASRLIVAF